MTLRSDLFERFRENVDEHARIERAVARSAASMHESVMRSTETLSESHKLLAKLDKQIERR